MMRQHAATLITSCCFLAFSALQGEVGTASQQESELLSLLDDATEMVTHSKLNIDDTPSVISVITQQQLHSLGFKTLFDALSILPGIETSVNQLGFKKVVFRGFDNPNNFTFDKAQLIVDGVNIETGFMSYTGFYLDLPVDVIERIEVLRGPGSALYGTGAFNGVINVITKKSAAAGDAIFLGTGSYSYLMGGGRSYLQLAQNSSLHTDVYYQKNKKRIALDEQFELNNITDPSTFTNMPLGRPLESNEKLDDFGIGMTLTHKDWTILGRFKDSTNGNFYGWDENAEMSTGHSTRNRYLFVEGAYTDHLNSETTLTAKIGYNYYQMNMDGQNYISTGGFKFPYYYRVNSSEERFNVDAYLTSKAVEEHTIVGGIELTTMHEVSNSIDDTVAETLQLLGVDPLDAPEYGKRALYKEDTERNIGALYLRDSITLSDKLSTLIALRMDYYSEDHKAYPSAQAGLVYNADKHWNLKLNYGHAFRMPSWTEKYSVQYDSNATPDEIDGTRSGDASLVAETTDTFEAVAIWRHNERHHLQTNLYYSIMENVLDIEETDDSVNDGYTNYANRTSKGIEMAYTFIPYQQNRLHLNATYNETTYYTPIDGIDQLMPGVAKFMAKGYYIHYFAADLSLSALVKYIGDRDRNKDFSGRDEGLGSYTTVDTTLNIMSIPGWHIHLSVKNLFDAEVRYTSYYYKHDGLPREGRNYLLQADYTF